MNNNSPSPPTPSIGSAKVESLNDPAIAPQSNIPSNVEPTFAPIITHTPLVSVMIHAPTKTTVITETMVLLCVIHASTVPEITDFHFLSVKL